MTPEESLEVLRKQQRIIDEQQAKVYRVGDKYYIDDDNCAGCFSFFEKMEARHCGNGYLSWRCKACWLKQEEKPT